MAASAAGWLSPAVTGALVVLMPKCPMCLAGYLALATGVGISIGAAEAVRGGLVAMLGASLLLTACMGVMAVRKYRGRGPRAGKGGEKRLEMGNSPGRSGVRMDGSGLRPGGCPME